MSKRPNKQKQALAYEKQRIAQKRAAGLPTRSDLRREQGGRPVTDRPSALVFGLPPSPFTGGRGLCSYFYPIGPEQRGQEGLYAVNVGHFLEQERMWSLIWGGMIHGGVEDHMARLFERDVVPLLGVRPDTHDDGWDADDLNDWANDAYKHLTKHGVLLELDQHDPMATLEAAIAAGKFRWTHGTYEASRAALLEDASHVPPREFETR